MHGMNYRFFFPWEQMFFLMQNIFIVPAMQHGCRANPLQCILVLLNILHSMYLCFSPLFLHFDNFCTH